MAPVTTQASVGVTATLIAQNSASSDNEGDYRERAFLLKNITGDDIYLGGSGVTIGTGFRWSASDGTLSIGLEPGEAIYGVAASAQTVHVLRVGR